MKQVDELQAVNESHLRIFEGAHIEVFEHNGQVLFNPKHVADILGIKDVNSTIRKYSEKQVVKLTNSNMQVMHFRKLHNTGENFLTESGVYKLIFKSQKEEAERFQDWVTDEVLPSIRKHGMYAVDDLLDNPDLLIMTAQRLKEEKYGRLLAERKLELAQPAIQYVETIAKSEKSIKIGDFAKLISHEGCRLGQNKLFAWMRDNGYLTKKDNKPLQKYVDLGVLEVSQRVFERSEGVVITFTPYITGKGQEYFYRKLIKADLINPAKKMA